MEPQDSYLQVMLRQMKYSTSLDQVDQCFCIFTSADTPNAIFDITVPMDKVTANPWICVLGSLLSSELRLKNQFVRAAEVPGKEHSQKDAVNPNKAFAFSRTPSLVSASDVVNCFSVLAQSVAGFRSSSSLLLILW